VKQAFNTTDLLPLDASKSKVVVPPPSPTVNSDASDDAAKSMRQQNFDSLSLPLLELPPHLIENDDDLTTITIASQVFSWDGRSPSVGRTSPFMKKKPRKRHRQTTSDEHNHMDFPEVVPGHKSNADNNGSGETASKRQRLSDVTLTSIDEINVKSGEGFLRVPDRIARAVAYKHGGRYWWVKSLNRDDCRLTAEAATSSTS